MTRPSAARFMDWLRRHYLPAWWRRIIILLFLTATVATIPVSLSAAQILLTIAVVGGAVAYPVLRFPSWLPLPRFYWPLLGFIVWSVVSALCSDAPLLSLFHLKKLLLFFLIPMLLMVLDRPAQARTFLVILLTAMTLSAGVGLIQYATVADPLHRIHGLMSHHMTFSGQLMLALTALVPLLLTDLRARRTSWPLLLAAGGLLAAALVLTLTRGCWIGFGFGATAALLLTRPRWLLAAPVVLAVVLLAAPGLVRERVRHLLDPAEAGNAARLDMMRTGLRIVADRPLVGVGPRMIDQSIYRYGADPHIRPDFYQHLHNNIIQIAAERGLPALAFWLWLMAQILADHWRRFRKLRADPENDGILWPVLAIAVTVALLVGGLFEYNFGDSEVLLMFCTFTGLAYLPILRPGTDHERATA
ncbi:MAG TPA: O-antigen ligase family protein [Acidobacteriota bacterium]|nr:O-antigen ligase family protein [Acidobacteriota bacterium]